MLTTNEKKLIADALNGCGTMIAADPSYLQLMAGDNGALSEARFEGMDAMQRIKMTGVVCSGLEHEIYDACQLNGLGEKWDVDPAVLLGKIASMSPAQRESICRTVGEIWSRCDEHFDRDLEAMTV